MPEKRQVLESDHKRAQELRSNRRRWLRECPKGSPISWSRGRRKFRRPDSRNSVSSLPGDVSSSMCTSSFLSQAIVSGKLTESASQPTTALINSVPAGTMLPPRSSSRGPATKIAGFDASIPFRKTEFYGQGASKEFEEEHWLYHRGEMIYSLRAYCGVANQLHAIYQRTIARACCR